LFFFLQDDQRTCKDGPSNYLIFAHRIDIRQVSLDIDYMIDVVLPLPQISNVVALDVDTQNGDIYWADTIEVAIMKSSADGLKVETIFSESVEIVDGLVVDSVGKKVSHIWYLSRYLFAY
jgi:low-density lipoprotein receptor-related protein 4